MRIESIKIASHKAEAVGLKNIEFTKLGQIVLIAGRNGAGKSRALGLLSSEIPQAVGAANSAAQLKINILERERDILNNVNSIRYVEEQLRTVSESDVQQVAYFHRDLNNFRNNIVEYNNHLKSNRNALELADNVRFSGSGSVLSYVPNQLNLADPNQFNKTQVLQHAQSVSQVGIQSLSYGTLAAIQVAQDRNHSATHQDSTISEGEKAVIKQNYTHLKDSIKLFLGIDLKRDADDNATLFGKPLGQAGLSNGQIILLQLCVALHAQEAALADLVLLLDEPENHLHPAALNYVLDRLQSVVTRGQIWIATHSVNVLAHFDNPSIYYMEDGELSFAGDIPEKVLESLLGDEAEREKLTRFLALPFEMANLTFAYESLLEPAVVMTGANDPQLKQIWNGLAAVKQQHGSAKILDYGAGRGRLIATMQEVSVRAGVESPASWLDYVAYDYFDTHAAECQANIERVYPSVDHRYYNNLMPLRAHHHEQTFDLVLLSNVFHEIPPAKWLSILGVNTTGIVQLLKEDGVLLIIEDQRLPHGEHAHEYGFLLFDEFEFQKLFQITPADKDQQLYVVKSERDDRLKAHYFKRELLQRVTADTRKQALEELQKNALAQIRHTRDKLPHTLKNGRLHAFWMNQYANAQLALLEV